MTASTAQNSAHRGLVAGAAKIVALLAAIVAVVLVAAMAKGWSLPVPLAALNDNDTARAADDWCSEHSAPESVCYLCNPRLRDELLWCIEHDLPEALCTLCHPDLETRYEVCSEHKLPVSFCPSCNRAPVEGASEVSASSGTSPGDGGEQSEESSGSLPLVRMSTSKVTADAGIEVSPVRATQHTLTIQCNGEVRYNQNRYAQVRPRVEGIVREVRLDVGASVRRGDMLAMVDSARLGDAKADLLAARALVELEQTNVDRIRDLAEKQITARKNLVTAESRLKESQIQAARARQTLLNLGFRPEQVDGFVDMRDTSSLLAITAPLDGVVVHRRAVEGEAVDATTELFAVADLSTMWVHLDLYEKDVAHVRPGQTVWFHVPGLGSEEFPGKVSWMSPEVDARTRTVSVRSEVENRDGLLRANMFGQGTIEVEDPHRTLVVPKDAVQTHEGAYLVFVKNSDRVFEPRTVQIGHRYGPFVEVTAGVEPGEPVVTTGSFLLKTELSKGSIGAGCCER